MNVRCPKCAAKVEMKKTGHNWNGDCPTKDCGFRFRGEAPAPCAKYAEPLTPHEENVLTLIDAIFPDET